MDFLLSISPLVYLVVFILLMLLTVAYLFWDEQQLRQTLSDIQADRRVEYLLRRLRHRSIAFLFAIMVIFCSVGIAFEDTKTKLRSLEKAAAVNDAIDKLQPPDHLQPDATAATTKPPKREPEPSVVLDLFTSDAELASDQSLDSIKKRYENALTGAYVLSHCNRADKDELTVLLSALRDDIIEYQQKTGDSNLNPQELYKRIVSAAEGSFQMVYSKTSCDAPEVDALEQQFASFILHYHAKHDNINNN